MRTYPLLCGSACPTEGCCIQGEASCSSAVQISCFFLRRGNNLKMGNQKIKNRREHKYAPPTASEQR